MKKITILTKEEEDDDASENAATTYNSIARCFIYPSTHGDGLQTRNEQRNPSTLAYFSPPIHKKISNPTTLKVILYTKIL